MPKGILAKQAMQPRRTAPIEPGEEPGEASENESPAYEKREEADPSMEVNEPGEGSESEPGEPGEGGQGAATMGQPEIDPRMLDLAQLVASRALDALAKVGGEFRSALKADPVQASVEFGTHALRQVAQAATEAGKPLPFEVVMAAGMMVIKEMAAIAVEAGLLPEEQIETFLKEVLQQSIATYARLDRQDGLINDEHASALTQAVDGAGQQGE